MKNHANRRVFLTGLSAALGLMGSCDRLEKKKAKTVVPLPPLQPTLVTVTHPLFLILIEPLLQPATRYEVTVPQDGWTHYHRGGRVENSLLISDMVISLGLGYDAAAKTLLSKDEAASGRHFIIGEHVPADQLIPLGDSPTVVDHRIWLEPKLWSRAIDPLVSMLTKLQPGAAKDIELARLGLHFDLEQLAERLKRMGRLAGKAPVAFHTTNSSLRYLARAMGLPSVFDPAPQKSSDWRILHALNLDQVAVEKTPVAGRYSMYDISQPDALILYAADLLLSSIS
jgi:ABC-type Zn uptake system ZnuABC Zn-binding protein ZnuA